MLNPFYWHNHRAKVTLPLIKQLWWKLMPGVTIKVKWPNGEIIVDDSDPRWEDIGGATMMKFHSADPNDHYRPWMEENVGKQGWDWDWCMTDDDVSKNRLTIKFRRRREHHAIVASLKWA